MEPHDLILVIGIFAFGLLEVVAILRERKRTAWRRRKPGVTARELRRRLEDGAHEA